MAINHKKLLNDLEYFIIDTIFKNKTEETKTFEDNEMSFDELLEDIKTW